MFRVESLEEAKTLSEGDPAVKAGRLVVELHPWMVPRGRCRRRKAGENPSTLIDIRKSGRRRTPLGVRYYMTQKSLKLLQNICRGSVQTLRAGLAVAFGGSARPQRGGVI